MPAILNYATSYQRALQTRYAQNGLLHSHKLWNSPSNSILQWRGHDEVRVPVLEVLEGRKDRDRRTITTPEANYKNTWQSYRLTNERYWSTLVDPSDIDETGFTTTMFNITRTYNDTEKIPEKDKQMFSSLYNAKLALDDGSQIVEETLTKDNFLKIFDTLMTEMDELQVPQQGRTIFCTPPVRTLIKNLQDFGRTVPVQNSTGEINRIINRLDEVTIEPAVPSVLMKTAYDFTVGAKVVQGAQQIQMMLIHIPCMCAPEKYSFVGFDSPSAATAGNALYYEQSYDDVILFESRHEGLALVVAP